uniref:Uncharacterized protein n=1 Tax=Myoviridae sp. ct3wi9 TaxID=2826610 RepID=A0A8S5MX10_9CAUD|nr:MAG TPA: hypothetical protein [Myoviridae sp. ct3wi9]
MSEVNSRAMILFFHSILIFILLNKVHVLSYTILFYRYL